VVYGPHNLFGQAPLDPFRFLYWQVLPFLPEVALNDTLAALALNIFRQKSTLGPSWGALSSLFVRCLSTMAQPTKRSLEAVCNREIGFTVRFTMGLFLAEHGMEHNGLPQARAHQRE